jgi:hypothetical protein
MSKIATVKLGSCGPEVADFRKNWDCGIAKLRLRSNISLKSCGITIAEVLPSSCGIAIADSKKSCACPPLTYIYIYISLRFLHSCSAPLYYILLLYAVSVLSFTLCPALYHFFSYSFFKVIDQRQNFNRINGLKVMYGAG